MKKISTVFCLVATLGLVGLACSGGSDPKTVAEKFWNASKSGDPEKVKPYLTKASLEGDALKESTEKPAGDYELGEVKVEGDRATVATVIKDEGMSFDLKTVLLKEGGKWKVDLNQTMMSILGGSAMQEMVKGLEELGKTLGEGMKSLGEGIAKAEAPAPAPSGAASFNKGDPVKIEWHGSWYPATVLEVGSNKWKIHYDGYSNSWDEWVGPDRIK